MNAADLTLSPKQKLLQAIFGPYDDEQAFADKTDDVLSRIKQRLDSSHTRSRHFASRIEACAMIHACLDRLWNVVHHDIEHFLDPLNFEGNDFIEVIEDHAIDLAAVACRMLIDLDYSKPA